MRLKYVSLLLLTIKLSAATTQMQTYLPPSFKDDQRLVNIEKILPEIDAIYKQQAETEHYPGYAYGIVLDGKLIAAGSGGYSDLQRKIPATPQSMFRIASMTKSFTAMAILKLRDEGKLRLDDPVTMYIPELNQQKLTLDSPPITIRDLLTHTAGFPTDDPWADRKLNETDTQLMEFLRNGVSFSNSPAVQYEYSNLGYTLLGSIINRVSGIPYQEYISENIVKPIGMKNVAWNYEEVSPSQLAHGYKWIDDQWVEEPLLKDGIFGAMGGMITSIESFVPYVTLHMNAWPARNDKELGPVKRSSIREMQLPQRFKDLVIRTSQTGEPLTVESQAYGYGLFWKKDLDGKISVWHSGGLPGFGSNWTLVPDYGLGVMFFTNRTYAPTTKANEAVIEKIIKDAKLQPRQLPPSPILRERQQELVSLLPNWTNAGSKQIFADNFFLDNSVDYLKRETQKMFSKAGEPVTFEELIPQSQLSGSFLIKGGVGKLKVSFELSPDNPPLIQEFKIEEVAK